ncbi:MAG: hypothetical protein C4K60_12100 [Ideonella sp. MAG2]|nr:MAG: hypothetical protein C4K60_12100 [Ideonella sp. MAG2]
MTTQLTELFDSNRRWAQRTEAREPGFFSKLLEQQTPQYLWIGCADSRVPANELVGLLPGELFVHRNVANVVAHSDLNALSVIQFAVDGLKVQHIIVVGHSNCGGVKAALNDTRLGLVDNWLRHVKDVRHQHQALLASIAPERRVDALCELNVLEQARMPLPPAAEPQQIRDVVQSWLQRQARRVFEERCQHFAQALGVTMKRLSLSSAQTRWGSATADGSIRLNWRLIHFGLPVIDYVVAHELAHLREMNHSPAFWEVVRSVVPDFARARERLVTEVLPPMS